MVKRTAIAGVAVMAALNLAAPADAASHSVSRQHQREHKTTAGESPMCVTLGRHRTVYSILEGELVLFGPWSRWHVVRLDSGACTAA